MAKTLKITGSQWGFVAVIALMAVTLYMAFAFPTGFFHLKQSETTELKSVIIVSRNGDQSPSSESFFIGEEPPEDLHAYGYNQLTNAGKSRMYMLGKYLKTRYYDRLLDGNPRKLYVRSADSDMCLESAEATTAGLNPPAMSHGMAGQTDSSSAAGNIRSWWSWFTGMAGDQSSALGNLWQPKAIHTTVAHSDDLLSSESSCLKQDAQQLVWKNTTKYAQLLNQFRHDLQTLRQNTGLEFEDDLEMLNNIDESLRARKAWQLTQQQPQLEDSPNAAPNWYTSTYADRLAHISDLTAGVQFGRTDTQRLYVGRLVHELLEIISIKVGQSRGVWPINKRHIQKSGLPTNNGREKSVPHNAYTANVIVYMTDKQHLTALLSALQIYSSQPNYGTALLIELHYDPNQQQHFLRLYLVGGASQYDQMPEPVRMNPGACMDSPTECSYKQFERNLRKSALNRVAWRRLCLEHEISLDTDNETSQPRPTTIPSASTSSPLFETTTTKESETSSKFDNSAAEQAFETTTTTVITPSPTTTTENNEQETSRIDIDTNSDRTNDQNQSQAITTTTLAPITSQESITTTVEPNNNEVTDSQDMDTIEKLDSTLIVGPTQVRPITTTMSAPTTTVTTTTSDSLDNNNNDSDTTTTYMPPQTNYYGSSSEPNQTDDMAPSVEPVDKDQSDSTTIHHMGDIYYSA